MEISKLREKMVITKDSFNVGEVYEAEMDDKWKITHLQIRLTKETTKELGFKKPMLGALSVCLPVTAVKKFGDVITLKQSLQEFKNLKECKVE